ncbi:hypothetical protein FRC12_014973, partial [Ceratobasidium sp. 428]
HSSPSARRSPVTRPRLSLVRPYPALRFSAQLPSRSVPPGRTARLGQNVAPVPTRKAPALLDLELGGAVGVSSAPSGGPSRTTSDRWGSRVYNTDSTSVGCAEVTATGW